MSGKGKKKDPQRKENCNMEEDRSSQADNSSLTDMLPSDPEQIHDANLGLS